MHIECHRCGRTESKPPYGANFDSGTVDGFCSSCIPLVFPMAKNGGVGAPQNATTLSTISKEAPVTLLRYPSTFYTQPTPQ